MPGFLKPLDDWKMLIVLYCVMKCLYSGDFFHPDHPNVLKTFCGFTKLWESLDLPDLLWRLSLTLMDVSCLQRKMGSLAMASSEIMYTKLLVRRQILCNRNSILYPNQRVNSVVILQNMKLDVIYGVMTTSMESWRHLWSHDDMRWTDPCCHLRPIDALWFTLWVTINMNLIILLPLYNTHSDTQMSLSITIIIGISFVYIGYNSLPHT